MPFNWRSGPGPSTGQRIVSSPRNTRVGSAPPTHTRATPTDGIVKRGHSNTSDAAAVVRAIKDGVAAQVGVVHGALLPGARPAEEPRQFSLVAFLVTDGHSDKLHEEYQMRYMDLGAAGGGVLWLRDVGNPGVMDPIVGEMIETGALPRVEMDPAEFAEMVEQHGGEDAYRRKQMPELKRVLEEVGARSTPPFIAMISLSDPALNAILPIPRTVLTDPAVADTFWRQLCGVLDERKLRSVDPSASFACDRSMSSLQSYLDSAFESKLSSRDESDVTPMILDEGTPWSEVRMTVRQSNLDVEGPGARRAFEYAETGLGMRDTHRLRTVLRALALAGGELPADRATSDTDVGKNLKHDMSDLRKRVEAIVLGPKGSPIVFDKDSRAYRTQFKITTDEPPHLSMPFATSWRDVSLQLLDENRIRLSVSSRETFTASGRLGSGNRESELAERELVIDRAFDLWTLRLVDESGAPNAIGRALLRLLGQGRPIQNHKEEDVMLELNAFLVDWLGISESPFVLKKEQWTAKFMIGPAVR